MRETAGRAEAEELRRWIIDTEYGSFGLPRISFVRQSLGKHRNGTDRDYLHGGQDIHESDIDFQIRVRDMYRRLASEDGSFIPIDCGDAEGRMLPPETIFSKVKECYENHKKN